MSSVFLITSMCISSQEGFTLLTCFFFILISTIAFSASVELENNS